MESVTYTNEALIPVINFFSCIFASFYFKLDFSKICGKLHGGSCDMKHTRWWGRDLQARWLCVLRSQDNPSFGGVLPTV